MIKKRLLLLMILPAILVIIGLGFAMSVDDEEPRFRVSVIVDSSSDGRWLSFRAGLEQAAEERNLNLSYVNTGRLVSPVDMSVSSSISHRELTAMERFANSPALYLRKKSAGSDMTRIIMEA